MVSIDRLNGKPEATTPVDEPKTIGLEDAGHLFETLSSENRRRIMRDLGDGPANIATVADRIGMSIQSVTYHVDKLQKTGLVEVVDTHYSEKGREIDLYGPTCPTIVVDVYWDGTDVGSDPERSENGSVRTDSRPCGHPAPKG